jgi:hypothetical protein
LRRVEKRYPLRLSAYELSVPKIRYCLGRRLEPANEQLVATDHQGGKVIVAPIADNEPSVFPVPHDGRPRRALAEVQQAPIFLFHRFRTHREPKAEPA